MVRVYVSKRMSGLQTMKPRVAFLAEVKQGYRIVQPQAAFCGIPTLVDEESRDEGFSEDVIYYSIPASYMKRAMKLGAGFEAWQSRSYKELVRNALQLPMQRSTRAFLKFKGQVIRCTSGLRFCPLWPLGLEQINVVPYPLSCKAVRPIVFPREKILS
jgi:hypothetical protein